MIVVEQMRWLAFLTLLSVFVEKYETAKILAVFGFPVKSHVRMLQPIARKLAEKGHELDVVSHFPTKNPVPRYNDISVEGSMPILTNVTVDSCKYKGVLRNPVFLFTVGGLNMCEHVLGTEEVKTLANSTKKYDLLISHLIPSDCMNVFGGIFKIPIVSISTTVNQPWFSDILGIPDNPSYIPHNYGGLSTKMSLFEKLWNTIDLMMFKIGFNYFQGKADEIIRKHLGEGIPTLREISKNISLIITNSHFSIQQPRPVVPNFIEIAGVHIDDKPGLSKHFQEALNVTSKGVIYVSFGSMLMTESLPDSTLTAIFDTFKKLPYKVLWKAKKDLFPKHLEIPPNIQFEPWMPQLGILCHPNTKLFISHGGMFGTQEANYCGVPILGIPVFVDQPLNVNTLATKGIAIKLRFDQINEELFLKSVKKLLEEDTKRKAEEISRIFRDRPLSPLETAIYWIEYVIKHNGAYHLRSYATELPWYQLYHVDTVCILLSVLALLLTFIWCTLKYFCKIIFRNCRKEKSKVE